MIGKSIGPYQILAELGRGGMGEVYRARDAKLNRDVALKILPDLVAGDPDRLARFEREAQVLASLNHPNIGAIYGVEDSGPTRALVLELVEGPTLADRLLAGALPVAEALAIARQIADALATAHEAGVIHRDLKPANVKVRDDGAVKVLDFGLAKALSADSAASSTGAMNSPTLTARATEMGMIIGTAAYMAPEQARGKSADRRADLWAFGVVLYEMLTGRRAFQGPEVSDVLAAVLRDTPSFDALPPDVPASVRRLLRRTLEKDRAHRLDSMAAARLDLDDQDPVPDAGAPGAPHPRASSWHLWVAVATAVIVSGAAAGAAVWNAMQPAAPQVLRFAVMPTAEAPIAVETNHADISITPDGSRIVYFSRINEQNQFAVRTLDRFEPIVLKGLGETPRGMNVSDDGEWIVYQSGSPSGTDAGLFKVPIAGGPPTRLADIRNNLRGTTWASPGEIIFATVARPTGLFRVSSNGGVPEVLTSPKPEDGEVDHLWPHALPGGRHVLFAITRIAGIDIAVLSLDTNTWKVLVKGGSSPRYSPTGHIVFGVDGVLKVVPFDVARIEVTGDPVQVLSGVSMKESGAVDFAISRNGTLVYLPGQAEAVNRRLVWREPDGKERPLPLEQADYSSLRISPDGKFAAALVGLTSGANDAELRLIDLDREVSSRLTSQTSGLLNPIWSPDSRRIAFGSGARAAQKEPGGMFVVSAAGTTAPERITTAQADETHLPGAWTNDGRELLFTSSSLDRTRVDVLQYSFESGKTTPVLAGPGVEAAPALSPDGRWLAYALVEARSQIFVRPFPNVDEVRIPISTETGQAPTWSRDGRTLFYRTNGVLHSVSVTPTGRTLTFGKPMAPLGDPGPRAVDIAMPPAGNRFLVASSQTVAAPASEYRVILNWTEELKARASAKK